MREILFRGKTQGGEWAYGIPVVLGGRTYILSDFRYGGAYIDKKVIGETVGQFTGLKDRHGKKIFEGDIVRFSHPAYDEDIVGFIDWEDNECGFVIRSNGGYAIIAYIGEFYEIIGNAHDNPELLEV
jgi:uncharacterized phage protein (TIGR01671 family)